MQIQTLNIFTGLPTAAIHLADVRELLASLGTAGQPTPTEPGATIASPAGAPPASGEYWAGQGGHYVCTHPAAFGLPARHLIVGAGLRQGDVDSSTPRSTRATTPIARTSSTATATSTTRTTTAAPGPSADSCPIVASQT